MPNNGETVRGETRRDTPGTRTNPGGLAARRNLSHPSHASRKRISLALGEVSHFLDTEESLSSSRGMTRTRSASFSSLAAGTPLYVSNYFR